MAFAGWSCVIVARDVETISQLEKEKP